MNRAAEDFSAFPASRHFPEIRRAASVSNWEVAHYHDTLEFNLVVAGRGAYFLEDRHYDLLPGTLVWLLPFQSHRLLRAPGLDMWVGALGERHYTPEMLAEVAQHPIKRLAANDAVALDRLFSHVSQDADAPAVYEVGMQYAVRSAIQIARNSAGPPPPVLHPAVTQALALLRADDAISNLSELAKRCRVSANYLAELLVSQTGRGFVEWRNIARLDRFQNFYPESEDLLTAALAAGFGSYTQFHRVFQDMIGTTPGHWARKRTESGPIKLPQMSQARDELTPGSQRLLWYNLSAVCLRTAGAWLAALLQGGVAPPPDGAAAGEAIASGCDELAALQALLPRLADELAETLPELAPRIRTVFAENDVFQQFVDTVGPMGADHRDLTNLAMVALAAHSLVANWSLLPTSEDMSRLLAFVRYRAALPSAAIDPNQRQEIAAGLIIQAQSLRNAWIGGSGSVSDAIATQVSETAHAAALRALGIDLRQTPLYGPLSPLEVA
ncbi:helix-turn-helix domain-containing protein [Polymorphobacter fuscus]|uniref:Helix-turn-helix domain-containing protein n=1 Tax=Sandarakinorhabdus fusca TaxID=1439888 RepID=A0A7C9KWX7_9SPHN|nr:helix-turn-helix transcriptional regulator [Polymorphobacter fuscus]KAB7647710.1 AraC family transcriptional regulator [Polymorphobacter fuscus]MQT17002.1 helix-turn-helix domain-containing protein [Polymorphobacter fuscus]NJC09007.1 AraC-like DNA-binding protein [Polymorphobacter fuscus]